MLKDGQRTHASPVLDLLKEQNPHLDIQTVFDESFGEYGHSVAAGQAVKPALDELFWETHRLVKASVGDITAGVQYTADLPELHELDGFSWVQQYCFGGQLIEAGCCWGVNQLMNGMEYHKSSELLGAVTDLVLFLGKRSEITKAGWHSRHLKAFYVPRGNLIELYSTTLHLAPMSIDGNPFYAVIMLPEGTNTERKHDEKSWVSLNRDDIDQRFLYMNNKWMLVHAESNAAKKGAPVGITGPNTELFPIRPEELENR